MRTLLCILFITATVWAQNTPSLSSFNDLKQKMTSSGKLELPEPPIIEHPVDAETYILGPGDVLGIMIAGREEESLQKMISPEGFLILPATGNIKVAGLSLADARKKIKAEMASKYVTTDISIALVQIRMFRVTVSGAVHFPGLVEVSGMDRASDAILRAGGLLQVPDEYPEPNIPPNDPRAAQRAETGIQLDEEDYQKLKENQASKRNIRLKRRNGSVFNVDLLGYERAGNLNANPYLVDGDVIVVPSVQEDIGRIMIRGAVRTPDEFEWAPGDNIGDLIALGHGFALDADTTKLFLTRFEGNSSRANETVFDIDWSDSVQVASVMAEPLQPDDRLFVRRIPKFHRARTVELKGEVVYPGHYALTESPTMLSDIIDRAGGFTDDAAVFNGYVIRQSLEKKPDPNYERLEMMMVSDMQRDERGYYEVRNRQRQGLVNVNFEQLFIHNDDTYDVPLKNDDLILVPSKTYTVNVIGQVQNPGVQVWKENRDEDFYIDRAGGYNKEAWKRKVRVIKASTGEFVDPGDTEIQMGDTIFVPPKIETRDRDLIRDITSVVSTVAVLAVYFFQIDYFQTRE